MNKYLNFNYKEANFRLSSPGEAVLMASIISNRALLDEYITGVPSFRTSLSPLPLTERGDKIPEIAARMYTASDITGLGPMASVAGGFAQLAVETGIKAGEKNIVVENGGDISIRSDREILLGIYPGNSFLRNKLAFRLIPSESPLAICSSSSVMGHSLSLGKCDLATVTGPDAFLVDSAATRACNEVKKEDDIEPVLEKISSIPGIEGILIIFRGKIGIAGILPELVQNRDGELQTKITRDIENREKF